ncbi:HAD-IIA family hydrolase [Natronorarus salvus]|uniref:HAD-IIA family hydrolase n=1 Tax=Natronorarus salvus TaxID=3117733 RepID=UPI002F25F6CB
MEGSFSLEDLNGIIIDIDGTVCRGDQPIQGASDAISIIQNRGIDTYFVTNNASKRRQYHAQKLKKAGINAEVESIITSGWIAIEFLKSRFKGKSILLIGEDPFKKDIVSNHLPLTTDPLEADILLVGLDTSFDYPKLSDALQALSNGATYVATNTDASRPSANRRVPSTGALLAAINTASGTEPDYITGKPSLIAIETCMEVLGIDDPSKWCVVGDRLETDVTFGKEAGMFSVLVLTGVHSRKSIEETGIKPNRVLQSLSEITDSC